MTVDPVALDAALATVNRRMRSHGGGVELVDVSPEGAVRLRFVGLCCGCPWKPLTWFGTVEHTIADVDGVTSVEADGTRISAEAERRVRAAAGSARIGSREHDERILVDSRYPGAVGSAGASTADPVPR